jgi:ferredoxin-fold anticodon binding domain-containing protein
LFPFFLSVQQVQENAIANRRKEKAELIVEYMSLLSSWRRKRIEKSTQYFHALLQADADGDLIVEDDDWQGGLAALREDIEESNEIHAEAQRKAIENMKNEFEKELASLRNEMVSILRDLSDDVKALKKASETEGAFTGKRVAGAVRAVKEIRQASASLLTSGSIRGPKPKDDED